METVEQMKSQLYQCQKLGFQPGTIICPKESEEIVLLRIKSMDDETVKVAQTLDGHELVAPDIKLAMLLSKYRIHRSKVTEVLPGWNPEDDSCSPLKSSVWQTDLARSRVHLAMAVTYAEHEMHGKNLELLMNPKAVKVKSPYNKSELQLPAASPKIDRKASKTTIEVGLGMHIAPHFAAPFDKDGKVNASKWVVPFWLVGAADDENPPNMALRYVKVEVMKEDVFVPVLVNIVALSPGDTLRWNHDDIPPYAGKTGAKRSAPNAPAGAKAQAKKKQR